MSNIDNEETDDMSNAILFYRMGENGPPLLKEILESKGRWQPYVEGESEYWNLWWKGSRYRSADYSNCLPWQRMNHFPQTAIITRKDNLFRTLKTMKAIYGSCFDFIPQTFSLPNDYVKFVRVYAEEEEKNDKGIWICKPADSSRGRKIFVFRDLQDLTYDCNAILQRYITNPLLISGYKFDIRCYVLVRSFNPLNIYIYQDGLTRFATSPYDTSTLDNKFSHLTNTSINKFSPTLNYSKDGIGPGCKWSLCQLKRYFNEQNMDYDQLWNRMKTIMILTLLPVALDIETPFNTSFELYGFDIIVDSDLRPWLLEVNMSPALSVDEQVDIDVKKPLLQDIISLVGITEKDAISAQNHLRKQAVNSKGSRSSLSVPPPLPLHCPPTVGKFQKIFPLPSAQKNQAIKITKQNMKTVIRDVVKSYGQWKS